MTSVIQSKGKMMKSVTRESSSIQIQMSTKNSASIVTPSVISS
jgi:hypothetical protein